MNFLKGTLEATAGLGGAIVGVTTGVSGGAVEIAGMVTGSQGTKKAGRSMQQSADRHMRNSKQLFKAGGENMAETTSYIPGVGHAQSAYAMAVDGDEARAQKYAMRATGTTVAVGATFVTGGLAAPAAAAAYGTAGTVAVGAGAGAYGATAGLASRKLMEAAPTTKKKAKEVSNMSCRELAGEIALGGLGGAVCGTLPGIGKAATGVAGQGGLGTMAGAGVADCVGAHGATRAGIKMAAATGCQKAVAGAGRQSGLGKQ